MDPWSPWLVLAAVAVAMVVVDLLIAGRRDVQMGFRESVAWNVLWFGCGVGFAVPVWLWSGGGPSGEYLAAYLLERSLSLDNIFVFAMIFNAFAVPMPLRSRALFWGIVGAFVLRLLFILGGVALIGALHWTLYLMGGLLVVTGIRMAMTTAHPAVSLDRNRTLRVLRRFMPIDREYHGTSTFIKVEGHAVATPMLAVLAVIATTDLVFALDSIPAVFAITLDPFTVVAANVFALVGLRSLYSLLAGMLGRFQYLQAALSVLLVLIGIKLLLTDVVHIPVLVSLALVISSVGTAIVASILVANRDAPAEKPALEKVD